MAAGASERLPNAERAIVELRRVRDYLLKPDHPSGGPKSKFFVAYGFTTTGWDLLRTSLLRHGRTNSVVRHVATEWGIRYTVACNFQTPDGRDPSISSVWQMERDVPRLLTVIPARQ
jgi:filamentous hemagglutinin